MPQLIPANTTRVITWVDNPLSLSGSVFDDGLGTTITEVGGLVPQTFVSGVPAILNTLKVLKPYQAYIVQAKSALSLPDSVLGFDNAGSIPDPGAGGGTGTTPSGILVQDFFNNASAGVISLQTWTGWAAGGPWVRHPLSFPTGYSLQVQTSGRMRGNSNNPNPDAIYYSTALSPPDPWYVRGIFRCDSTADSWIGIGGRQSLTANTSYFVRYRKTSTLARFEFMRFVNGSATTLGTQDLALTVGESYSFELQISDTLKRAYGNGSLITESVENNITYNTSQGFVIRQNAPTSTTPAFSLDSIEAGYL